LIITQNLVKITQNFL